ncbi:MAG TPA: cytochrome c family protein [Rhizomicrobium sp.]|jgi:cytochrome c
MRFIGIAAISGLAFMLAGGALAAGDPAAGKSMFSRCAACHNATKGGPNMIGPNLFGVVGRNAGSKPGFSYSNAMKSSGITWTPDKLDTYLTHPAQVVPGNRMAFAGISDAKQRADLIAYLGTLK